MSDGWKIEMCVEDGRNIVRDWIEGLDPHERAAVLAAIDVALRTKGPDVCSTEYGKPLGDGLFELRIRHDADTIRRKAGQAARGEPSGPVLLRVFCHAYGATAWCCSCTATTRAPNPIHDDRPGRSRSHGGISDRTAWSNSAARSVPRPSLNPDEPPADECYGLYPIASPEDSDAHR
jgi:Phage derived protein Gp49-like (DUF891)